MRVLIFSPFLDIIFGQMREVIATMSVEEIKGDRLNFVKGVNDSVECELKKIGLTLINVNITDIQGMFYSFCPINTVIYTNYR